MPKLTVLEKPCRAHWMREKKSKSAFVHLIFSRFSRRFGGNLRKTKNFQKLQKINRSLPLYSLFQNETRYSIVVCGNWKRRASPFRIFFQNLLHAIFTPPFIHIFSKTHFCKKPAFPLKPNLPPNRWRYSLGSCCGRISTSRTHWTLRFWNPCAT